MRARALLVGLAAVGASALASGRAAAQVAVLREVRPIVADDYTRLVFDTSRRVSYTLRQVAGDPASGVPPRLYVDFESTRLAPTLPRTLTPAGGPLRRMRGAELPGGITRIVLDVPGLRAHRAFPLLDPFRLVVDVEGEARPVPVRAAPVVASRTAAVPALPAVPAPPRIVALPKDRVASRPPVKDLPDAAPHRRPRLVLDPGHGGKDPGAIGAGGAAEKDIVLALCKRLARQLEAAGFEVLLTRDRDVFLSLEERTARANAAHADLFVSVHANASRDASASGIETYYLSNSGDRATIRLAQMENQLAHMTGKPPGDSDVSWIVSDMIQSYKVEASARLARTLQSAVVAAARRDAPAVRDLGAKPGPFYVLVGAGMPAVLVEVGFVTHADEARRIAADGYQAALANGLLYGIDRFVDAEVAATL